MDWKDIAGTLVRTGAPLIGTALGGPIGGTIGGVLGNIVAGQLGVEPTPEAVNSAIVADPAGAQAKLAAADAEAAAKWDAIARMAEADAADRTAQQREINETIRAEEAAKVPWYHWRHLLGYVTLIWFVMPLPAFVRLTISFNVDASAALVQLIGAAVPILGFMAALLGYVAQDTTKLKTAAITGEQPNTLLNTVGNAAKAVVKRK